jgi:hypothetical protein
MRKLHKFTHDAMRETMTLFTIRNKDGNILRSGVRLWEEEYHWLWLTSPLQGARVYESENAAKSAITFIATRFPDEGVPELVPLLANPQTPIDQTERVKAVWKKKGLNLNEEYGTYFKGNSDNI